MVKLSVVILNWNGRKLLEKFLGSVVKYSQTPYSQVVVVDNGSTDSSVEYLTQQYPDIKLITLDRNYGFTQGYNLSLKMLDTPYFLLLNSDVEVTEGYLEPLMQRIESDKRIGAVMPKILSYNDKSSFEYAGAAGGLIDIYGFPYCRGRVINSLELDNGQWDIPGEIFWASGAAMLVPRDVFTDMGGFDTDYFAHMEEIDLCWRMKNHNYKIFVEPHSVVYHLGGGTLANESAFKLKLNFRNSLFTLYKNLPSRYLFRIMFTRMILDGMIAMVYLITLRGSYFLAVFKAHIEFYKSFKDIKRKRASIEHTTEFPLKGMLNGSLLLSKLLKKDIYKV